MGDHECPRCLRPAFFGVPHECRGLLRANVPLSEPIYWDATCRDDDPTFMLPMTVHPRRACRECGCTTEDACVDPVLGPCRWVEWDLCSSCAFEILDDPRPREPRSAYLPFFALLILGWIVVLAVLAALVTR